MELQAAIEAFGALNQPCEVEFYTDSEYVKNGICDWLQTWKRNGWKTKSKKRVKNEELWRKLDSEVSKHKVVWNWVKGHAGNIGNERCDQLANEQILKIKKSYSPERLKELLLEFTSKADTNSGTEELF